MNMNKKLLLSILIAVIIAGNNCSQALELSWYIAKPYQFSTLRIQKHIGKMLRFDYSGLLKKFFSDDCFDWKKREAIRKGLLRIAPLNTTIDKVCELVAKDLDTDQKKLKRQLFIKKRFKKIIQSRIKTLNKLHPKH